MYGKFNISCWYFWKIATYICILSNATNKLYWKIVPSTYIKLIEFPFEIGICNDNIKMKKKVNHEYIKKWINVFTN